MSQGHLKARKEFVGGRLTHEYAIRSWTVQNATTNRRAVVRPARCSKREQIALFKSCRYWCAGVPQQGIFFPKMKCFALHSALSRPTSNMLRLRIRNSVHNRLVPAHAKVNKLSWITRYWETIQPKAQQKRTGFVFGFPETLGVTYPRFSNLVDIGMMSKCGLFECIKSWMRSKSFWGREKFAVLRYDGMVQHKQFKLQLHGERVCISLCTIIASRYEGRMLRNEIRAIPLMSIVFVSMR